ncbi:hypothetical protein OBBRIDRAFT_795819 [Obba rivulosa]|uniref:Uncharacterized protein n=1 Tax=Obba rivulosa TaxID=1052685 RepID=A0A8E2DMC7_9APHY|nr:hypothetical protein OBBRIDRAFT_795819 [Obba rivulosa]
MSYSNGAPGLYDERLLAEAPAATAAEKQGGYNVDLLENPAVSQGGRSRSITPPNAPILTSTHGHADSSAKESGYIAPYSQSQSIPWWRTRKWLITWLVLGIVAVAAIVGGAVGGTVGHHNSNDSAKAAASATPSVANPTAVGGGAGGGAAPDTSVSSSAPTTSSASGGSFGGGAGGPAQPSSSAVSSSSSSAAPAGGPGSVAQPSQVL